jgi:hypothetical protein
MNDSAAAASAADSCPFSCVMLLAVHGAVFLDVRVDVQARSESSGLRPLALNDIGQQRVKVDIEEEEDNGTTVDMKGMSKTGSGGKASVVSLVSPSNMGYSVMISEDAQFPNHAQVFIRMIESDSCFDENSISRLFDSYETNLYSLFRERTNSTRHKDEVRAMARASDATTVDFTKKMLSFRTDKMIEDDINARMQTTRDAIGLHFRPHRYAIGNKEYCPGGSANQCCLYFPGVDRNLHEALILRLFDYRKKQKDREKQKDRDRDRQKLLSDHLYINFDSRDACVLTIIFNNSEHGFFENTLWKGVSLDRFFRQIKELLYEIFHDVEGFDVEQFMSRTCVVDAACSDFAVRGKGVSIVGFTKEGSGATAGMVSALVDIHDHSEDHHGFWEYLIRHKPGEYTRANAMVSRRFNHRVVIPRELEDFVPACLTCLGSTIQKVEPVFDTNGNVVRVVYTYYDETKKEMDYIQSVRPDVPSQSMEAVQGSRSPDASRVDLMDGDGDDDEGDEGDEGDEDDAKSISSPRGHGGHGGRRRWRRTLKKKCMKKCKTKRQRRRRCKTTQKNAVKSRRRRTCVRRL